MKHFLDISALDPRDLRAIIDNAKETKTRLKRGVATKPLNGKVLAMIFEKPSTRTRVSFDVGMRQLGGETVILSGQEMQLGRDETIADTAKVLSRYVDLIMIRTLEHERLLELADAATVPVINGLTNDTHPCQIMADIMTFEEHKGSIEGAKIAWTGDGNNVLHSFVEAAPKFGFSMSIAVPKGNEPQMHYLEKAKSDGAAIEFGHEPKTAVTDAHAVVTDTWVSMGLEDRAQGHNVFVPYQVNEQLMAQADPDAIFMHCLPAHRGEEVTDAVIDGPQSVVFDEAENRLHAQKAIMEWCLAR
ncbi:MAG: ornithine carbamoyltransferase [Pseudomonadota bacterium]